MPTITINGKACDFTPGQMILQVANAHAIEIPQYCYHDGLSIVASCRICLAEIHAPDPRQGGKLAPFMGGKLMPTCQTPAADGMVVYANSPKAVANQKAVMEYLLINHPLDCPVCDQAGECFLQDYSYKYGRGVSRFEETKVKNPKKDLGPHVYLYSDRCIMCTRCVRFTKEVAGTSELMVQGRGNREEIDIFPGVPIANELSANVIDLCPVGALLDKDFLFAQRVWFLKQTASIDGITASGDNIWIEHNEGRVYRIKPRENPAINKWWITDEVRYGWKHVHSDARLRTPMRREFGALTECDADAAMGDLVAGVQKRVRAGKRLALAVSPMLSCEDAYLLARAARALDPRAILAVGPVPTHGRDKVFPVGADEDSPKAFKMYAEKAPNARGVRRVLTAIGDAPPLEFDALLKAIQGQDTPGAIILTGNYPSTWAIGDLIAALGGARRERGAFIALIDTLGSELIDLCDTVLPGATWAEKEGCFENARAVIQHFDRAIPPADGARAEAQLALDLLVRLGVEKPDIKGFQGYSIVDDGPGQVPTAVEEHHGTTRLYNAAAIRADMIRAFPSLAQAFAGVRATAHAHASRTDMQMVDL